MNASSFISLAEAEKIEARASIKALPIFTARDLGNMAFPPIMFVVPGYLPEGATILAGRPKLGKSWLGLEMAIAVATGGECLGTIICPEGDVLYLALEDNQRRLHERIAKICSGRGIEPWPQRLSLATDWKRAECGGLNDIRAWAISCDNPRLVIVDVLAQFREGRGNQESQYESDYAAVKGLQEIAGELSLAVIIVHHIRKGTGDHDPFERVSGTMGLTGAADTVMVLDRDSSGCSLYCRGRDIQEYERAVAFDKFDCRWTVQGEASEVRRSEERSILLRALMEAEAPLGPRDLADATGFKSQNIRLLLHKMVKAGDVIKVGYGKYAHPDRQDLASSR